MLFSAKDSPRAAASISASRKRGAGGKGSDHGVGYGSESGASIAGGGAQLSLGSAAKSVKAPLRVHGAGVPGERRIHRPGQLGDRPGGRSAVWVRARLGPLDVEP